MSLEPLWYSTMYGVLLMAGQSLSALAFVIRADDPALAIPAAVRRPSPEHLHDLGKLLLAS